MIRRPETESDPSMDPQRAVLYSTPTTPCTKSSELVHKIATPSVLLMGVLWLKELLGSQMAERLAGAHGVVGFLSLRQLAMERSHVQRASKGLSHASNSYSIDRPPEDIIVKAAKCVA